MNLNTKPFTDMKSLKYTTCTISMNLDPCPLCGGESEVVKPKRYRVAIECKECRLRTRSVIYTSELQLIQEWNTRHTEEEKLSDTVKYMIFFACMIAIGMIAGTIKYFLNNGG